MPLPTAWIRWVLPRPTPPYRNSGLYEPPGFSATCIAAARASWFALPVTKVSNVRFGFSRLRSNCSELPATLSTTGPGSAAGPSPAPSPFGNRMADASAEAPSTANTIATGRWAMRDAACAMRSENCERMASSFSRFGAPIVSVAVDSSKSSAFSGLIQAENCCGVSSVSRRREQSCQMCCIEVWSRLFLYFA